MTKKLAIIGASYLQLPLVKKCKTMGIESHCFAWEEGAVCKNYADYFYPISILDKESILKVCRQLDINGIISIASDAAMPTVSYVADQLNLIANSSQDSLLTTDKFVMRNRLNSSGILCPRFTLAFDELKINELSFPLIVKPTDRSGSRGVQKVNTILELKEAVQMAKSESFKGKVIVEEFIEGIEVSVESISWRGDHFVLAITDKVTSGYPNFIELEHHQPSTLPKDIQDRIKRETVRALASLDIQYGASHSEFRIDENGKIFIIEVGARMGGDFIGSDLVQLSTGFDFVRAVIEIALGDFNEPILSGCNSSGVFFLSDKTEFLLPYFNGKQDLLELVKMEMTGESPRKFTSSADRYGYLIYKAKRRIKL